MKHLLNLLVRKDFSALFWAQISSVINDNLIRTALTALIAVNILTLNGIRNSTLVLMIIGTYILPFFIFSLKGISSIFSSSSLDLFTVGKEM